LIPEDETSTNCGASTPESARRITLHSAGVNGRVSQVTSMQTPVPAKSRISPKAASMAQSRPYGSYQLKRIPAGPYKVISDTSGAEYRSPSEIQFYSSKSLREDAQVLELSDGQKIMGIDFRGLHRRVEARSTARIFALRTSIRNFMGLYRLSNAPRELDRMASL
jgi:hypothetical protein